MNKDEYYMNIANAVSEGSYCKRNKVGSVIVKEDRIISTGYNGTIMGTENNCEKDNVTHDNVVHSEENAILSSAKFGISLDNSKIYVTLSPCVRCARMIKHAGIKEVVYLNEYRDLSGIELLKELGIKCKKL